MREIVLQRKVFVDEYGMEIKEKKSQGPSPAKKESFDELQKFKNMILP